MTLIGSIENEDPENEDPKTYENEDPLRKRRSPTKTKTPYENEDTYENEDLLRKPRPLRNFYDFNFNDI